jgi:transposase InsO family protein
VHPARAAAQIVPGTAAKELSANAARKVETGTPVFFADLTVHCKQPVVRRSNESGQFRSRKFVHALSRHEMVGSMGRVRAAGDNAAMESFFSLAAEERPRPPRREHPRGAGDCDCQVDRGDLTTGADGRLLSDC